MHQFQDFIISGVWATFFLDDDWTANINTADIQIYIVRNGISVNSIDGSQATFHNDLSYSYAYMSNHADLKLMAGDVVKIKAYQNNGAEAAVGSSLRFFGHLVFAE